MPSENKFTLQMKSYDRESKLQLKTRLIQAGAVSQSLPLFLDGFMWLQTASTAGGQC